MNECFSSSLLIFPSSVHSETASVCRRAFDPWDVLERRCNDQISRMGEIENSSPESTPRLRIHVERKRV